MMNGYTDALSAEFGKRIAALRKEGLVDLKLKLRADDDTTIAGTVAVLNNALRLRSEGKAMPYAEAFQPLAVAAE